MKPLRPDDMEVGMYCVVSVYLPPPEEDNDDDERGPHIVMMASRGSRSHFERDETHPLAPGAPFKIRAVDYPFIYVHPCEETDLSPHPNRSIILDLRCTRIRALSKETIDLLSVPLKPKERPGRRLSSPRKNPPSSSTSASTLSDLLREAANRNEKKEEEDSPE